MGEGGCDWYEEVEAWERVDSQLGAKDSSSTGMRVMRLEGTVTLM